MIPYSCARRGRQTPTLHSQRCEGFSKGGADQVARGVGKGRLSSRADKPLKGGTRFTPEVMNPTLEHPIGVRGCPRNFLQHIPMLHDLAVLVQAENINPRPVRASRPSLITMQLRVVAFCNHGLEFDALPRIIPRHHSELIDERLLSIRSHRIVLQADASRILLDCLGWLVLVEHQIVESRYRAFFCSSCSLSLTPMTPCFVSNNPSYYFWEKSLTSFAETC
jgi:hypothetical protein